MFQSNKITKYPKIAQEKTVLSQADLYNNNKFATINILLKFVIHITITLRWHRHREIIVFKHLYE